MPESADHVVLLIIFNDFLRCSGFGGSRHPLFFAVLNMILIKARNLFGLFYGSKLDDLDPMSTSKGPSRQIFRLTKSPQAIDGHLQNW
jgi:hypothetical protein